MKRIVLKTWFFPACLFLLLITFSLLKISGSSVGMFEQFENKGPKYSHDLIYGKPRAIRSDEYAVNTPLTISQVKNHFQKVNQLVGNGEDMSVLLDTPYREWSTVFKPQNWSFLVLPLEQAFAFKWWFLGWMLISACYVFLTKLLPKSRLLCAILSLIVFLSPLVQWWYQTITIAPLAYSFMIGFLLLSLHENNSRKNKIVLSALLAYFLTAFILILYPPFQIPCALGIIFFYVGHVLRLYGFRPKVILKETRAVILSVAVAILISGVFFITRQSTVRTILNTVYPGHRIVANGHFSFTHFLSGPFLQYMQSDAHSIHLDENQSEASTFIMIWPVLLIPSIYVFWRWFKSKKENFPFDLLFVNLLLLILAARLFLPLPLTLTKPLLLNSIPHNRLLIGFAVLQTIQLILLIRWGSKKFPRWIVTLSAGLTLVIFLIGGLRLNYHFPGFLGHSAVVIVVASLLGAASIWGLLSRYTLIGAAILLLLTLSTTIRVNPLYRGLGPIIHSQASQQLQKAVSNDQSVWAFLDAGAFTNYLVAQGLHSYTATFPYPQLKLWRQFDPEHHYEFFYNRYANVFLSSDKASPFSQQSPDSFTLSFRACSPQFKAIKHLVSLGPLAYQCLRLENKLTQNKLTYYIYSNMSK